MDLKVSKSIEYDPNEQLNLLKLQCKSFSKNLYKVKSQYLEHIRKILPYVVRQSVLSLITQSDNNEFGYLDTSVRDSLISKIDDLIGQASSLLTIENLLELSNQIEQQKALKEEKIKNSVINPLDEEKDSEIDDFGDTSINLSFSLPIDDSNQLDRWEDRNEINFVRGDLSFDPPPPSSTINFMGLCTDSLKADPIDVESEKALNNERNLLKKSNKKRELFKSLFEKAGAIMRFKTLKNDDKKIIEGLDEENKSLLNEKRLLPDSPAELQSWMIAIDTALDRRLRNLSYSINIELLRASIINTLIPTTLLDAEIEGQITTQTSQTNILKVQVPSDPSLGGAIEIVCVLLQSSDMEFDNVELRKYRADLKDYRLLLSKMVKKERHWQGRSLVNQVRTTWLKKPREKSEEGNSQET